jgi:putative Ca2+/H+ antiporter (TMEM165/GDT1 family)
MQADVSAQIVSLFDNPFAISMLLANNFQLVCAGYASAKMSTITCDCPTGHWAKAMLIQRKKLTNISIAFVVL